MTKIILNDLATISGSEQSAINLINANNAKIETASDNTLSRDGTIPNHMLADLDMNGNHILNLPAPVSLEDPVRLQDFNTALSAISLGTLPELYAVNYGVIADGVTNNNTALAALKTAIGTGGRKVIFPSGVIVFTSEWNVSSLTNVIFQGMGGLDLGYTGTKGTVLKFTGTGSGNIINMNEHRGVWWKDIQVVYTSNSFTGTMFNCFTTFSTGCGSGFENVQCYQITNFGHTAAQCYYLRNNVDVTWRNCYVSHATFGWVCLFSGETGEVNMIKFVNCTSIALKSHAVINPIIGCSFYSHNFESTDTNTPSGILTTGSYIIQNLNLYSCVFADATASGTWIDIPNNTFNFVMIGGALIADAGSVTGMALGSTFNGGLVVQGVLFSGLSIGVRIAASTVGAVILGNNFLNTATPISGTVNLDAGSLVKGNNPAAANI